MNEITTIDNNAPVVVGQKVWLYPANEKRCGTIAEMEIAKLENPWWVHFTKERPGRHGWRLTSYHARCRRNKLYSTLEAAQAQRALDNAEPSWQRRGKFEINCCATLISYLSHATGIDKKNIQVHKTSAGWLYVAWADSNGMHKEKMYCGTFYVTKQSDFAPLIAKMVEQC